MRPRPAGEPPKLPRLVANTRVEAAQQLAILRRYKEAADLVRSVLDLYRREKWIILLNRALELNVRYVN